MRIEVNGETAEIFINDLKYYNQTDSHKWKLN